MPLMKFEDFYPDYKNSSSDIGFDIDDIKKYDVYAQNGDKAGSVAHILVDDQDGRFRYFVVDTGFWIFGKKVLVPVGMTNIDNNDRRIYVNGFTKEQVENLPNFDDLEKIDYDYQEQVHGVYRPSATGTQSDITTQPMTSTAAMTGMGTSAMAGLGDQTNYNRTDSIGVGDQISDRRSYNYSQDADLYNVSDRQQSLRLYEEHLVADKHRQRTGEVAIGKHVETQTARVSVPVERERVVVERNPVSGEAVVDPSAAFNEGEVARVEVYEETPDVRKEAFVREEVQVKKVVERDTVNVEEQLRREELDVDAEGNPIIDKRI